MPQYQDLKSEYEQLFANCVILNGKKTVVTRFTQKIVVAQERYKAVVKGFTIPWYFIALLQALEDSTLSFQKHLVNGDPLAHRTVKVPKGTPYDPPANGVRYTWEESVKFAIGFKGFDKINDWSIPHILYLCEAWNGFGYRSKNIHTPYLWSFTNLYTKGKFIADHVFDPNAVSQQMGVAAILKELVSQGFIVSPSQPPLIYNPNESTVATLRLQKFLNDFGHNLKLDGVAGPKTSSAHRVLFGHYLKGDPRNDEPRDS